MCSVGWDWVKLEMVEGVSNIPAGQSLAEAAVYCIRTGVAGYGISTPRGEISCQRSVNAAKMNLGRIPPGSLAIFSNYRTHLWRNPRVWRNYLRKETRSKPVL